MSADQPERISARTEDEAARLRDKVLEIAPGVMNDGVLDVVTEAIQLDDDNPEVLAAGPVGQQ